MNDMEDTLEIDESELIIGMAKQMVTHHHEMAMWHNQAAKTNRELNGGCYVDSMYECYKIHELATKIHRLAEDLFRDGKMKDAYKWSHVADDLTDKIESGKWE